MKRHDESISDRLRRMAATDELKVGRGRAEQIAGRALARVEARPHRRARLVAAIVSGSAFAIVSVTGVGAIADQAVPGDSLYPVDRAYESITRAIGREVDRTQERLDEALVLAQRGEQFAALNHVNAELGQRVTIDSTATELAPEAAPADDVTTTTQVAAPADAASSAAPVASEAAPDPSQESAPTEEALAVEADESDGDSFVVAIEHAIRAIEEAAESQDEDAALAADEAVRSVVKLAADQVSAADQSEQTAPGEVTVATTTTTTPEEVVAADEETEPEGEQDPPVTAEDGQTGSATTTVPSDDSETESSGDGETAGDDPSGSQEGSGSAGEPGDDGEESPGPVFLPIP